jgi:hypothetical protein
LEELVMNRVARAFALAVLPLGFAVGVFAQDKEKKKTVRLQPYWSQLELSEKQREQYDRVALEYGPRIEKLEAELDAIKERRSKEWQAILSPAQKQKLESLRANRGKKKADEKEMDKEEEKPGRKPTRKPADEEPEEKKTTTKKKTTKKEDK